MAHSQARPPVSFDTLYKTYRPLVLYWAGVAGVPARDREDLMQAVFIKLYLAQVEGRFHGGDPRFWLCVTTFRLARDWLASWGSRTMTLGRSEVHETADENTRNPEQRARDHEESKRNDDLLQGLRPERWVVFVMVERGGLTLAEVAAALNISENTVATRLRLARRDLAKAYALRKARERGAFLPPFGLGPLPGRDLFAAMSRRATTWIAEARSALGHALIKIKAVSTSLGAGAGLTLSLGIGMVPPVHASEPAPAGAPKIAVAVSAASANPTATNAPAPASSLAAPLPASRTNSANRPTSGDPERLSLDSIQALLQIDPAAALAALDLHRRTFPHEKLAMLRLGIESLANSEVKRQQQARLGAAPP